MELNDKKINLRIIIDIPSHIWNDILKFRHDSSMCSNIASDDTCLKYETYTFESNR